MCGTLCTLFVELKIHLFLLLMCVKKILENLIKTFDKNATKVSLFKVSRSTNLSKLKHATFISYFKMYADICQSLVPKMILYKL